ncbi:DUF3221 domain-containing protein [Gracilibacillus marinus]|uniref:DUF3221 domain-containing protein n=1 Tax=Gracilibacillus marinus TaxID=630535 RepID=A0ABV8VUP3_9BACI
MKKMIVFILLSLALIACSSDGEVKNNDEMIGYIAKITDDTILVTEKYLETNVEQLKEEEMYEKMGNAIYFKVSELEDSFLNSLQLGDKVVVTYSVVAESYPGQSTAMKMEKVKNEN